MALVRGARAAVVTCWMPLDAGSREVLLWLLWRVSQWDLRWQSPQRTQSLSSGSCWGADSCDQPCDFKHPTQTLSVGTLSLTGESSWVCSVLRILHISSFSWNLPLSFQESTNLCPAVCGTAACSNTFSSLLSADGSCSPLNGQIRLRHKPSHSPNFLLILSFGWNGSSLLCVGSL